MDIHTCARCKRTFWTDEMAQARRNGKVRYVYCKPCAVKLQLEWRRNNPTKYLESSRRYYAENKGKYLEQRRERSRLNRLNNPAMTKAVNALNHALRNGKISRQLCEVCKDPITHAHHEDYNKPLEVRWLCPLHHIRLHHNA